MTKSPTVAAAGICCLDHIVTSPRVKWGDTSWVNDYRMEGGGLAATAMVACARLGASCSLLSLLGDDQVGDVILAGLRDERVDVEGVQRIPGGQSPFSFIHVDKDTGERTIFHRPGVGLENTPPVNTELLSGAQVLLIDDIYRVMSDAASTFARRHGVPVVADLAPNAQNEGLLRNVDVVIAPYQYARDLGFGAAPESALREIRRLGPKTAIVTLGADGYVWSSGFSYGKGQAFSVRAVDTTAAGDAFHGAFCYGLACGWDTPKCCEFAAAVAAIKCSQPGGRAGLPGLDQTLEFLKDRGKLDWRNI